MKFLRENVGRKQPVGGNSDDARDPEGVPEPLNNLHESVVVGEIQGEGGVLPLERSYIAKNDNENLSKMAKK